MDKNLTRGAVKYRIETRAGLEWDDHAIATDPVEVARLAADAVRTGYATRIVTAVGRRIVRVSHDSAGRVILVPVTRGGRRAGAGRPATGRTVRPVQLHLPPDVVATIDAQRGDLSRSQWVAQLIAGSAR